MTIHTKIVLFLTATVLTVTAAGEAHCLDYSGTRSVRLVIGVDRSLSTVPAQANVWSEMAEKVTKCLKPGDAVTMLEIHTNTAQSSPVFEAQFPVEPTNATIPQKIAVRNEALRIRRELGKVSETVFEAPKDSHWTDILGVFERIHDSYRQNLLLLFSDGVHSTQELDLEKIRLGSKFVLDLQRFNIRAGMLQNTPTIAYFVLPSLSRLNRQYPVNDRVALKSFYESLLKLLGGRLATFSVDLPLIN